METLRRGATLLVAALFFCNVTHGWSIAEDRYERLQLVGRANTRIMTAEQRVLRRANEGIREYRDSCLNGPFYRERQALVEGRSFYTQVLGERSFQVRECSLLLADVDQLLRVPEARQELAHESRRLMVEGHRQLVGRDYEAALRSYRQAYTAFSRALGGDGMESIKILLEIARVESRTRRFAQARADLLAAKAIVSRLSAEQTDFGFGTYRNLAWCEFDLGHYREAEIELKKCRHCLPGMLPPESGAEMETVAGLARIHNRLGRFDEAER